MADDGAADDAPITFSVKSSSNAKYSLTVPRSSTVGDLKEKLSTADYADIPADRQRLIYSGRVLKDADTLDSYKIKDGHTVHLVKGADSNQRQTQPGAAGAGGSAQPVPPVPTLSAGTGNNPLAGLTGGRYAGFAQLPSQDMFGPDGGMGPPPDPEDMIRMLQNPQFASTLNEALANPQLIDMMIQQNPLLRDMGPQVRQMLQTPEFRRMMTDPDQMRSMMQMQRMFGGGAGGAGGMMGGLGGAGAGGAGAFPAPGVTDTTPEGQPGASATGQQQQQRGQGQPQAGQAPPFNPLAAMFGAPGAAGAGAGANPLAALFNPTGQAAAGNTASGPAAGTPGAGTQTAPSGQQPQQPGSTATPPNPTTGNPSGNPFFQNPQLMAQMLAAMNGGQLPAGGPTPGQTHPFADLLGRLGGAAEGAPGGETFNPFGAGAGGSPPPPADTRPPEERYADQLRQLNDMGFYEFERNVQALRRAGGSVQGAVEYLLTHGPGTT